MAIIHSLPNLGFTKGWITRPERMAALRDRHPNRYLLYATVDSPVTDTAIGQLELNPIAGQALNRSVVERRLHPS